MVTATAAAPLAAWLHSGCDCTCDVSGAARPVFISDGPGQSLCSRWASRSRRAPHPPPRPHANAHASAALRSCRYDLYGLSDHDMAITYRTLQALCREFNRLEGTRYFPGVLRYETLTNRSNAPRFLPDNSLCCNPQIASVIETGGRRYIVPFNPFQALFFMPAADLRRTMQENRIRLPRDRPKERVDPRAYWATYWLHNNIRVKVPALCLPPQSPTTPPPPSLNSTYLYVHCSVPSASSLPPPCLIPPWCPTSLTPPPSIEQ